jgi:hypothetical protein
VGIRASTEAKSRAGGDDRAQARAYRRRTSISTVRRPAVSAAPSVALPQAPVSGLVAAPRKRGISLLFAVIIVTSISAFALSFVSFVKPIGSGDGAPAYADIADVRSYVWAFFIIAGVQLVVGASAAALAAWLLVPRRGSRWATAGASLIWLGAALYGVGIGGWATIYYFGTDPHVLDPAVATRLIDHVNDDTARMLAVPIGGALLIAIGSLALSVALWRARSVPRWLPIATAITAIATVLLAPDEVGGLIAEAASSATTILIGWYVWQAARPSPAV